jgi:hypothetical protein
MSDDQDRTEEAIERALRILCNAADTLLIRERAEPTRARPIARVVVLGDRVVVAALDRHSVPQEVRGQWRLAGDEARGDPVLALVAVARGLFALRLDAPECHEYASLPVRRTTIDVSAAGALIDLDVFAAPGADEGVNLMRASQEREPSVA